MNIVQQEFLKPFTKMVTLSKAKFILKDLLQHLEPIYSPLQIERLLHAYIKPRKTSFRINSLKTVNDETKRWVTMEISNRLRELKLHAKITSVPWSDRAFIMSDADAKVYHLSSLSSHVSGRIHFQSLSSILPPLCLDPKEGQRVLDMCAAPGGKTMQLMEAVGPKGFVVANDVDSDRIQRLYKNLQTLVPFSMQSNLEVRIADARKLMIWESNDLSTRSKNANRKTFDRPFDAILLDAPCSGEGIVHMGDPSTYRHWNLQSVKKCARIQRQILDNAYHLLRPGGTLVYSTCTLSPMENEEIVQTFLNHYEDMEIIELGLNLLDTDETLPNFSPGLQQWATSVYSRDMTKALRIFPSDQYEGFFVCRMQKRSLTF